MKTVEILIRIPQVYYDYILSQGDTRGTPHLAEAIVNGTVLPKGHGRLKDVDKLKTHFIGTEQGTDLEVYLESTIIGAPTIIEADKEE